MAVEGAVFCTQCGTSIPEGNRFCGSCGSVAAVLRRGMLVAPADARSQEAIVDSKPGRPGLITFLGIAHAFWFVVFLLAAVGGFLSAFASQGERLVASLPWAALAALELSAAYGLLTMKPYGRRIQLFWAGLSMLGIPVGTAVGYLLIQYLRRPDIRALFGTKPRRETHPEAHAEARPEVHTEADAEAQPETFTGAHPQTLTDHAEAHAAFAGAPAAAEARIAAAPATRRGMVLVAFVAVTAILVWVTLTWPESPSPWVARSARPIEIGVLDGEGTGLEASLDNLSGDDVASAAIVSWLENGTTPELTVQVNFTPDGAAKMSNLTRRNIGRELGFRVGTVIVFAVYIQTPVRESAEIMFHNVNEAQRFVENFRAAGAR